MTIVNRLVTYPVGTDPCKGYNYGMELTGTEM